MKNGRVKENWLLRIWRRDVVWSSIFRSSRINVLSLKMVRVGEPVY